MLGPQPAWASIGSVIHPLPFRQQITLEKNSRPPSPNPVHVGLWGGTWGCPLPKPLGWVAASPTSRAVAAVISAPWQCSALDQSLGSWEAR